MHRSFDSRHRRTASNDPFDLGLGEDAHVAGRARRLQSAGLGVGLRPEATGEPITRAAPNARSPRAQINTHRSTRRVQSLCAESPHRFGDIRLVLQRRVRIGRTPPRLGRILSRCSMHVEQFFYRLVIRLKIRVRERPCRTRARRVVGLFEIGYSKPRKTGSIYLGVATHHVMHARRELPLVVVEPHLSWLVPTLYEDRFR